jgi:hypothetical protein
VDKVASYGEDPVTGLPKQGLINIPTCDGVTGIVMPTIV